MDTAAALRDVLRDLLARHSGSAAVRAAAASPRGYDHGLWVRLCGEVGVAGLAVPEKYGGAGAGLAETQIALEELGRVLAPTPMLGSAVIAAQALLLAGDDDACERLLPGIAAGERIATLAWTGRAGGWSTDEVAYLATETGVLDGEAHYVLDGDHADTLLAVAHSPDGIRLYELDASDPGIDRRVTPAMDITRRLARIALRGAHGRRLGDRFPLDRLRDIACVALSAEQVGAAARALELTVAYTKSRVQFGQAIGGFQALQHRLADLHVLVESARSASYAAAEETSEVLAAVAKVYCSETLHKVAAEMIQLHGGIGITWEHDAHLYFKRAHGAAHLFGAPQIHLDRLGVTAVGL
jgi:alkylation response protein AidB-like acyl-CoA dehydrogenase